MPVSWLSQLRRILPGGTTGRNKHGQRGNSPCPRTGELTHLWKPSSLCTPRLWCRCRQVKRTSIRWSHRPTYTSRQLLDRFHATSSETCLLGQNLVTFVACPVHSPSPMTSLKRRAEQTSPRHRWQPVQHCVVTTAWPQAIAQHQLESLVNETTGTPRVTSVTFGNSN